MAFTDPELTEIIKVGFDTREAEEDLKNIKAHMESLYAGPKNAATIQLLVNAERQRLQTTQQLIDMQKLSSAITQEATRPEKIRSELLEGVLEKEREIASLKEKAYQLTNTPGLQQKLLDMEKEKTRLIHEQTKEILKQGLDPQQIKETVRRHEEIAKLERETSLAKAKAETPDMIRARLDAAREMARIEHDKKLLELKEASRPDNLREKVAMEKEMQKAREEYDKQLAKERREQERPGFFQKLFQDPGKAFGDVRNKLGEYIGEVKDEHKKGGVGGILDSLFAHMKGGGGGGGALSKLGGALIGSGEAGVMGAMGGAAAGAMGGPIGIGIAAAMELIKITGKLAAAPFAAVNKGLSAISGGLHSLQGPLGAVGLGLDIVSGGFDMLAGAVEKVPILGDLLGPMFKQMAQMPKIVGDILNTLTSFAGKANPAVVERLSYAIDMVQATIGQTFLPVVNLMIEATLELAKIFANILPNFTEMNEALEPLRSAMRHVNREIDQLLVAFGPLIRDIFIGSIKMLGYSIQFVIGVIEPFIDSMKLLYNAFAFFINANTELTQKLVMLIDTVVKSIPGLETALNVSSLGTYGMMMEGMKKISEFRAPYIGEGGEDRLRAATHPSRPAQFQSFSSYAQQAYQAAYSLSYQEKMFRTAEESRDYLKRIAEHLAGQRERGTRKIPGAAAAEAAKTAAERQREYEGNIRRG